MSELKERLALLGLSQYREVFLSEGFDTWDTILDITESDLNTLNVKLGHRRKLQRAIAESRGQSSDRPLPIAVGKAGSFDASYRSDESATEGKGRQVEIAVTGAAGASAKRKYRRHPKTDDHAPERPPSAYVIFSNQVRETLRGRDLSFTEIAKIVGERWQVLDAESRESCEQRANAAKEKYYNEMAEYKKTPEYEAYQKYLDEFKTKHAAPPKGKPSKRPQQPRNITVVTGTEGKRSKLETETSTSTTSSSHEHADRSAGRRTSSAQADPYSMGRYRSDTSPPIGPARLPSAPLYPSKSTSPATYPLSALNSPRMGDQYSPLSASPRSATVQKESSYDFQPSALGRDRRGQSDTHLPFPGAAYGQPHQASGTPPLTGYPSHYQTMHLPSRRPFRDANRPPPLTHEDTTLSSESGGAHSIAPYSGSSNFLPIVDTQKSMRVLPQPVPMLGPSSSRLDPPLPPVSTAHQQQQPDPRTSASLAALLRAGELARVAVNDEEMEKESSL